MDGASHVSENGLVRGLYLGDSGGLPLVCPGRTRYGPEQPGRRNLFTSRDLEIKPLRFED